MNLNETYLNINTLIECTEIEGPGKRFCIWLQGCNIGCKNCINEDMLSFEPKQIISTQKLNSMIELAKKEHSIEGITLLGGEPFLQAKNLSYTAEFCQQINLSVMCFSGFSYQYLNQDVLDGSENLLKYLDILVDGIYIEKLEDSSRNWVGSSNQKFYYLTNKYNTKIETETKYKNKVEIRISDTITINGEANLIHKIRNYISSK